MKWMNLGCFIVGLIAAFYLFVTWRFTEAGVMAGIAAFNGLLYYSNREKPATYNRKASRTFHKGGWKR